MTDFSFPNYPPVERPTVRFYLEDRPFDPRWEDTVAVQWIGESREGRLVGDPQFRFHLCRGLGVKSLWSGHKDFWRVAFLGQLKDWPRPERRQQVADMVADGNLESWVAWIVNHSRTHEAIGGRVKPHNFVTGVVLLGDPTYGPIQPRPFADPGILDRDPAWEAELARIGAQVFGGPASQIRNG